MLKERLNYQLQKYIKIIKKKVSYELLNFKLNF